MGAWVEDSSGRTWAPTRVQPAMPEKIIQTIFSLSLSLVCRYMYNNILVMFFSRINTLSLFVFQFIYLFRLQCLFMYIDLANHLSFNVFDHVCMYVSIMSVYLSSYLYTRFFSFKKCIEVFFRYYELKCACYIRYSYIQAGSLHYPPLSSSSTITLSINGGHG